MLFFLVVLLCIAAFLAMVFRKKITAVPLSVCIVCVVLVVIHIGSGFLLAFRQEPIAAEVLDKISKVAWNDEEQLETLGFENHEGMMTYDSLPMWGDSDDRLTFFKVYVEEADDEEIKQAHNLETHKNMLYTANTSYGYANVFLEFIHYPEIASRGYYFYVDDRLISVREHNNHNTDRLFEQYMLDLNIDN